jgi:hypothetical protein
MIIVSLLDSLQNYPQNQPCAWLKRPNQHRMGDNITSHCAPHMIMKTKKLDELWDNVVVKGI